MHSSITIVFGERFFVASEQLHTLSTPEASTASRHAEKHIAPVIINKLSTLADRRPVPLLTCKVCIIKIVFLKFISTYTDITSKGENIYKKLKLHKFTFREYSEEELKVCY